MASFPPCAARPGDSAHVAHGCMGHCGAIHRRARDEQTVLQFHDFQAEDVEGTAQEAQTHPPPEPGGKGGAYGAN